MERPFGGPSGGRSGPGLAGWLPGLLALSVVWGASFALIKVAVDAGVAPVWVALWRCLFGALALLGTCLLGRVRLPRDRATWLHAAVVGALLNAVPFTLMAFGEQQVSSVQAGVINAVTPLATLLFGLVLLPAERLTGRRGVGLVLGLLGVLCLLAVWRGLSGGSVGGDLACLAATLCYGAGFSYTRRWYAARHPSAAALSALQIGCATVELALVAPWLAGPPSWPGPGAASALVVLGAVGTGWAYIVNLRVIRVAGSSVAAMVTYATPVWSTAIGALLLGEPLGWHTVLGAVLVLAGLLTAR
ncbi:MAG TPA: DMT family transporter [Pseudonocardia sp.]|nr:DMT family transporter [Pseudonocardia sp.]